jgi:hypothetical protein
MTIHHDPLCLRIHTHTHKTDRGTLRDKSTKRNTVPSPFVCLHSVSKPAGRLGGIGWQSKPTRLDSVEQGIGNDSFFKRIPFRFAMRQKHERHLTEVGGACSYWTQSSFSFPIRQAGRWKMCLSCIPSTHKKLNKQIPDDVDWRC